MSYLENLSKSLSSVFGRSTTPVLADNSQVVEPTINQIEISQKLITSDDSQVVPTRNQVEISQKLITNDDPEDVESTYPSVPDPHQIFDPTINRVPIPERLKTKDKYLVVPGVLEITQYNIHAYLLAHDKSQEQIHHHNLRIAYRNLYDKLDKEYNIVKGKMIILHGNIYNMNNCEIHKLYQPEYIFYNLLESNIKSITSQSLPNITVTCNKGKISEICLNESWRNAPIEWKFKLVSK